MASDSSGPWPHRARRRFRIVWQCRRRFPRIEMIKGVKNGQSLRRRSQSRRRDAEPAPQRWRSIWAATTMRPTSWR